MTLDDQADRPRPLSQRQREVLRLIQRHCSDLSQRYPEMSVAELAPSVRFIARVLGLSASTVQQHVEAIYLKGWLASPSPSGLRCLHHE